MSWAATAYAQKLRRAPNGEPITIGEKLVMIVLANYYNEEKGFAWPSLSRLSDETLYSRRGLVLAVQSLERKGLIEIVRHPEATTKRVTNHYRFPKLESSLPPLSSEGRLPELGNSVPQTRKASSPELGNSVLHIFPVTLSDLSKDRDVEEPSEEAQGLWFCAEELLGYLNAKTARSFLSRKPNKKPTASLQSIYRLLQQGYTAEQIRQVIDDRVQRWRDDAKMREYLRPETLFRASKFEQYLGTVGQVRVGGPKAFQPVTRVVMAPTECPPEAAAALSKILGRDGFSFSADRKGSA